LILSTMQTVTLAASWSPGSMPRRAEGRDLRLADSNADADVTEWVTFTSYLFASLLSARAAAQAVLRSARDGVFWRITAVLLA
jgi:hypothetical protein